MKIYREAFKDWLESLPEGFDVGSTWYSMASPLSTYLRHLTGELWEFWSDGTHTRWEDINSIDHESPPWVEPFHAIVNGRKDLYGAMITREQALSALEQIP